MAAAAPFAGKCTVARLISSCTVYSYSVLVVVRPRRYSHDRERRGESCISVSYVIINTTAGKRRRNEKCVYRDPVLGRPSRPRDGFRSIPAALVNNRRRVGDFVDPYARALGAN